MSNSYTAVPAIIPGPLQVNGLLTVASDQGIKIGGSAPFVRVYKSAVPSGGYSYNLGTDEATQDTAAIFSSAVRLFSTLDLVNMLSKNAGGTLLTTPVDRTIAQDGTVVGNTGNVTENTTRSKVIPANTLGADGALIIEWLLIPVAQGATATTFRLKLGGVLLTQFTKATAAQTVVRLMLNNLNATNSQRVLAVNIDINAVVGLTNFNQAIDTTVDQTLTSTIQNGAATDNWNDNGWKVHGVVGRAAAL